MSTSTPRARPVGLIGLGLLGGALAQRLHAGGFAVTGYDVDAARGEAWRRCGGAVAESPAAAAGAGDRLVLSLPTHLESAAVLAACAERLRPGMTVIDTTTGEPESAERLAREWAARGVTYLDVTVSGSSAQVREGTAVLMAGGPAAALAACADLFGALGAAVFHTGSAGSGARMKLVTNLVLGLNRAALAEGLALARGLGLDAAQALAIMRGGPAYSRIMDRKGDKMLREDFVPEARLAQHLKDVRLILAQGRAAGLPMPLSAAHGEILAEAERAGYGDLDNSAVIRVLGPRPAGEQAAP